MGSSSGQKILRILAGGYHRVRGPITYCQQGVPMWHSYIFRGIRDLNTRKNLGGETQSLSKNQISPRPLLGGDLRFNAIPFLYLKLAKNTDLPSLFPVFKLTTWKSSYKFQALIKIVKGNFFDFLLIMIFKFYSSK